MLLRCALLGGSDLTLQVCDIIRRVVLKNRLRSLLPITTFRWRLLARSAENRRYNHQQRRAQIEDCLQVLLDHPFWRNLVAS